MYYVVYYTGHYHQYDTIAYPRTAVVKRSILASFPGLGGFFTQSDNEIQLPPLGTLEMRNKCLIVYLKEHKEAMCTGDLSAMVSVCEEVQHIFSSLLDCHVWNQRSRTPTARSLDHKDKESFQQVCFHLY